MSKEFRQTLVGLLVIGVSLTLGYFFYQITPLHEMREETLPGNPMPLIGEVMVGTMGLGLCVMGVIAILGIARFIGSGGDI